MKHMLKSLKFRMLLPVIAMTLVVVTMLTVLFSRAYIRMILQQENEVNAVGFETVSRSVTPLISNSISNTRKIMTDDRVMSYARLQFPSAAELIRARISCRDFLSSEIARHDGIYGLLFMRKDGSLFGALPEANIFLDSPEASQLPEEVKEQILNAGQGQVVWIGPLSAAVFYGFENADTQRNVMVSAWKSVDISYGECYTLMLVDESVFQDLFAVLQDGKSSWHLFSEDRTEIYHMGSEGSCRNPDLLISESNSGAVLHDENGHPFCAFSMVLDSPPWTLVRSVSMENYELVVTRVRHSIWLLAVLVFLVALAVYRLWLRKFMRQFKSLQNGIVRMGEGDLESASFEPTAIEEFITMQHEINRTREALGQQMDTIRRMERERMEQENMIREQEQLVKELSTARQIQTSVLPHIFPPFPERKEIDLYASMDPAKDVGGDFYDFFFTDEDHLCLVIADVSGKSIPGALFMMFSKRIIEDFARIEHSAAEILRKTNEVLCDSNQAEMFVTVWLGILEISTGRLTAANAGHEYPAICKNGRQFEIFKDRHGLVIGVMPGVRYTEYTLQMNPGDRIFVYTDGVPEATAADKEMFGMERMTQALNRYPGCTPNEILKNVKAAVDEFTAEAEQFDDLTMMCLEYRGPAAEN